MGHNLDGSRDKKIGVNLKQWNSWNTQSWSCKITSTWGVHTSVGVQLKSFKI